MKRIAPICLAVSLSVSCGSTQPPPPPAKTLTTYRIMSGVSMGGTGAAALGFSHPDKFDGVAALGGPLDGAYFLRMIDKFALGGFCTLSELEAIAESDPKKLNDPAEIAHCAKREPTQKWEHSQDYNHWHYSMNGTSGDRDTYMNMFADITLAYGNLGYENPASPFAPPGVDPEWARNPPADACSNAIHVKRFYNAEYNPTGKYDAITFCDGQPRLFFCRNTQRPVDYCADPANVINPLPVAMEQAYADTFCGTEGGAVVANKNDHPLYMLDHAGMIDPCRQPTRALSFGLALDINGNGRRDYGEPVLRNGAERFDDVGVDGCADELEDGRGGCLSAAVAGAVDPNHDNYDPDLNALGTENDWLHQAGEPFRDDGLDGVPGTGDVGEGNGQFDQNKARAKFLAHDARSNFRALDDAGRKRLNVLVDGGIRDLFNLGVMSHHLFGLVKALRAAASTAVGEYRDFVEIPNMKDPRTGLFDPWGNNRWKAVPHDLITLYGKDNPTDQDRIDGEGDHVGTAGQAVNRFNVMFNWAAATWPTLPRPATPFGSSASERQKVESFDSAALGAKWEYAISLPPGYDAPENAEARYPVLFMLHGYGMDPQGFMGTALITDSYVTDTDVKFRPMILVFPNGRCCYVNRATGQKDCREKDENGVDLDRQPGFERECHSGNFYVNRSGYAPGDESRYGDAFFELMDHIDNSYRTLKPVEVETR